jgi:asparagine synthase (glutamine-hydrolysing)
VCGIAGTFAADPRAPVDLAAVRALQAALAHRGPDGAGLREGPGYALAHRRLAIVDLATGAQPLDGGTGTVWVTFNGQIYNFRELRAELEAGGARFQTKSDTEVLVWGWRAWGERLPERLRGMFAFALADEQRRCLFLARDRLGKKPLHWALVGQQLWFASELKALRHVPGLRRTLAPASLARFLCLRYVPEPDTIFREVHKLPAAHSLLFQDGRATLRRYWRLSFAGAAGPARPAAELAEELRALLDEATRIRLTSEVPLGAFLSGGIDSQAVVESMARALPGPVVACVTGFAEKEFDERPHARVAARRFGAVLHESEVTPAEMLALDWHAATFDEPFSDASAIPTFHVSRAARAHVTVALSGDGGDEAFAGYRRYRFDRLEHRVRPMLPAAVWSGLGALYPKADFLPRGLRFKRTLQNLGRDPALAYARSVCATLPEEALPLLAPELRAAAGDPFEPLLNAYRAADGPDPLARAAATDYATWLPGDVLAKVDRAAMAVGLEVRAPFLDHVLVEWAARLPSRLKLAGGRTKAFLRAALRGRLDQDTLRRRKQGFSVPLRGWLRGPVGAVLEQPATRARLGALLDVAALGRKLAAHRSGVADHGELLWACVVLDGFLARHAG